jgi:hypothetical protein
MSSYVLYGYGEVFFQHANTVMEGLLKPVPTKDIYEKKAYPGGKGLICGVLHRRLARIKRNHYLANTRCIG